LAAVAHILAAEVRASAAEQHGSAVHIFALAVLAASLISMARMFAGSAVRVSEREISRTSMAMACTFVDSAPLALLTPMVQMFAGSAALAR